MQLLDAAYADRLFLAVEPRVPFDTATLVPATRCFQMGGLGEDTYHCPDSHNRHKSWHVRRVCSEKDRL